MVTSSTPMEEAYTFAVKNGTEQKWSHKNERESRRQKWTGKMKAQNQM